MRMAGTRKHDSQQVSKNKLAGGDIIDEEGDDKDTDDMSDWVEDNMVIDRPSVLRDERARAAEVAGVSRDGSVVPLDGDDWTAKEKILACYVGAHYSAEAGYRDEPVVENQEFIQGLAMPDGTVSRAIKELRDDRILESVESGKHTLPLVNLTKALDMLEE